MLAGVCGGSSAPTWLIQTVLHAVSRTASSVSLTCTGSLEGKSQRRVGGLSTQRLAAVGTTPACLRDEGEVCVFSHLLARRNACAWGLLHALLPC